jgi:membrane fusion protein (multidrug efflux system)
VLAAALLAGTGCGDSSGGGPVAGEATEEADDAIAVRADVVSRGAITSTYTTSATLRADKQAAVIARTSGVIRSLVVEEGDRVSEGEPMALLEDDEQKIEHERAVAARDTTRREYERAEQLHAQGLLSDEEYETARREAEEARQTAALTELALSRTVIRAPFAGTVLRRHLDPGATVSDGTAVYDLADTEPLFADVNVPERNVARLAVGQRVNLVADASGEGTEARIERIAPLVDPATGTVKVTLSAHATDGLRPGSFVRVAVVTDTHDDALILPRSALVAEGRRWYVFRVGDDRETVQRVEVERGFEERDRVEILPAGEGVGPLDAGERVVVVGASALTDGSRIRLIENENEDAPGTERNEETAEGTAVVGA